MTFYSTADQAHAYNRSVSRGLAYEAQDRMRDMQAAILDAARVFARLKDLGHSDPWLEDAINGLLDQVSNVSGECRSDMDGLLCNFVPVDLSEIHELLGRVKGGAS